MRDYWPIAAILFFLITGFVVYTGRPTCSDGIMNQGEEGVDCGGPCPPCIIDPLKECESLSEPDRGECGYNKAVSAVDENICSMIENSWWRENCYSKIAEKTSNPMLCGILGEQLAKDSCIKKIAVDAKNTGYCALINSTADKDTCYYRIGIENNNLDSCGMIGEESGRLRCTALVLRNHSVCKDITSDRARDYCLLMLLVRDPVEQVCLEIQDDSVRGECYLNYAAIKADERYCANSGARYGECVDQVDKALEKLSQLNEQFKSLNDTVRVTPI
ncbi:MAG TPA: hypothetical protein ENN13_03270 [Candidatus Altiarchaeales archaeon]|nr:hypothetical protein [Candidatus Altiarchaeales archaeon]